MNAAAKRLSSLILALLLLLALLPGSALAATVASGKCGMQGENVTWTLDSAGTLSLSGSGETYVGSYITGVAGSDGRPWADYIGQIKKVVIGSGITTIAPSAFYDCTNLASVSIAGTVTAIHESAFRGCTSLASITIPSGVTQIGDYAFQDCSALTAIVVPDGVTKLGRYVFYQCSALKSASLPNTITTMGDCVFGSCTDLTSANIPTSLNAVPQATFSGCIRLPSIALHDGLKTIGPDAFADCLSLGSITIPSGVTKINNRAFDGCSGLKTVTIPAAVTSLGVAPFARCNSLTAINVASDNPSFCSVSGVLFNIGMTSLLQCPGGKTGSYAVPDGVKTIYASAFEGCRSLSAVTLPGTVTRLEQFAFRSCTGLKSMLIPGSVTYVGPNSFEYCTGLTGLELGVGIGTIDYYAFSGCTGLTNVELPDGLVSINGNLFQDCTSLKYVIVPASVRYISGSAFLNCNALTDIYYCSTEEDWGAVSISSYQNEPLLAAVIHYNSISESFGPTVTASSDAVRVREEVVWRARDFEGSGLSYRFQIYRNGTMVEESNYLSGASYSYIPLTEGTYRCTVTARDSAGKETTATSPDLTVTAAGLLTPGTIQTLTVEAAPGKNILRWSSAENATHYFIQRREAGGQWQTIRSLAAGNSFEDTSGVPGTAYQYRVRGRNDTVYGPYKLSAEVTVLSADAKPGAISSVTAAAAPGKTTVSWTASSGAAQYIIQRRVKDTSTWTTLKSNVTGLSYEDTTGEAGVVYQYRVRGRNGTDYGPFKVSSVVRAQAGNAVPGAIAAVTAKASAGKITVSWTASQGAAQYIIQRRVKDSTTWTTLKSNVTGTSYTDTTGVAGTVYQYRVRGRNGTSYGPFKVCSVVRAQ